MNVLLVHIDGKWPNLRLMKTSAYHKLRNDRVELRKVRKSSLGLLDFKPDVAYVSCIFSWNGNLAHRTAMMLTRQGVKTFLGGSGVADSNPAALSDDIEHLMPDYSLYDIDYSMGYTSRGCHRNCPWCLVPKLEGCLRDHAPISEFHHPKHDKIRLLDNNFLPSPKWKENLFYIIERRLTVNFSQGLDIRRINDHNANLLTHTRFASPSFKKRTLYFAFDDIKIEKWVRRGVEILKAHEIHPRNLRFYMLCGFKEPYNFEEDMYRFQVLRELGVEPYVMRYNFRRDIPILNAFARWINRPHYKVCKFEEFKPAKKILAHAT